MADHKPVEVDKKQLEHANHLWANFTVATKYAVIASSAILVVLMLIMVDF